MVVLEIPERFIITEGIVTDESVVEVTPTDSFVEEEKRLNLLKDGEVSPEEADKIFIGLGEDRFNWGYIYWLTQQGKCYVGRHDFNKINDKYAGSGSALENEYILERLTSKRILGIYKIEDLRRFETFWIVKKDSILNGLNRILIDYFSERNNKGLTNYNKDGITKMFKEGEQPEGWIEGRGITFFTNGEKYIMCCEGEELEGYYKGSPMKDCAFYTDRYRVY